MSSHAATPVSRETNANQRRGKSPPLIMYSFGLLQQMGMASNTSPKPEKCYDPRDTALKLVDGEDVLDFLCEDFSSRRAQMSCGHAVTPMSLTNWCRKQLEEGESRFVCGAFGCGAEWPYAEVCKMALLTAEEREYFEKNMALNAAETRACPRCKSYVVRDHQFNLRVCCNVCTANRGRNYAFCWQCLRKWKGPHPRPDRCGNDGCCNLSLDTLRSCPDIIFKCVKGVTGCPSIRACPTCGCLLEHLNTNCKHLLCPRCKVKFCFVCLKKFSECMKTSSISGPCSAGVAPTQISIPIWWKD